MSVVGLVCLFELLVGVLWGQFLRLFVSGLFDWSVARGTPAVAVGGWPHCGFAWFLKVCCCVGVSRGVAGSGVGVGVGLFVVVVFVVVVGVLWVVLHVVVGGFMLVAVCLCWCWLFVVSFGHVAWRCCPQFHCGLVGCGVGAVCRLAPVVVCGPCCCLRGVFVGCDGWWSPLVLVGVCCCCCWWWWWPVCRGVTWSVFAFGAPVWHCSPWFSRCPRWWLNLPRAGVACATLFPLCCHFVRVVSCVLWHGLVCVVACGLIFATVRALLIPFGCCHRVVWFGLWFCYAPDPWPRVIESIFGA